MSHAAWPEAAPPEIYNTRQFTAETAGKLAKGPLESLTEVISLRHGDSLKHYSGMRYSFDRARNLLEVAELLENGQAYAKTILLYDQEAIASISHEPGAFTYLYEYDEGGTFAFRNPPCRWEGA